ncbi:DUF72 domain-containing protein [bacterium]|nr:MAG: DUF72 domain-containing protein [bacterium]
MPKSCRPRSARAERSVGNERRRRGVAMLHIGTSGWSFPEWRDHFYPRDLPQKQWLEYYAQRFTTVELNAAFYRMPSAPAIATWRNAAPPGFLFSVKASQRLTHRRDAPSLVEVERFIARLEALGDRLGPFLFQFPPTRKRDDAWLHAYLDALPSGNRYAFEFRHASWFQGDALALLQEHGIALVTSDYTEAAAQAVRTASFGYVRFRGPAGADEPYTEAALRAVHAQLQRLFHADEGVFIYFHHGLSGVADAARATTLLH